MNLDNTKIRLRRQRPGMALVFVIIVLVVLTAIVYRLSSSISQWKHRQQYIIDYQIARYACESGTKYALATIGELEPNYVSRPNEPDFSDLFTMSDEEYKQMMADWAEQLAADIDANSLSKTDSSSLLIDFRSLFGANDINGFDSLLMGDPNADANTPADQNENFFVRGPYGAPWPYVTEPVELDFGTAKVTIEIMDENAKIPLNWAISIDKDVENETKAAVTTFLEWMQMEPDEIESFTKQMEVIKDIKPFSVELKPVVTITQAQPATENVDDKAMSNSRSQRLRARRAASRSKRTRPKTVKETRPDVGHARDFAKIMHSPMIDIERLAKPVNHDEKRSESALKYISLWGTETVNINTAPRHVLEAAFTFGGDSVEIAEAIINERRVQPFQSIDDLKKRLFSYSNSIEKCEKYITTQSAYFSIRIKATSGTANVSAVAGIKKEKKNFEKIGIITE